MFLSPASEHRSRPAFGIFDDSFPDDENSGRRRQWLREAYQPTTLQLATLLHDVREAIDPAMLAQTRVAARAPPAEAA